MAALGASSVSFLHARVPPKQSPKTDRPMGVAPDTHTTLMIAATPPNWRAACRTCARAPERTTRRARPALTR
jgi:hypothetical protein